MQPDELTLIAQIAQGNAHALRQLYALYRPRLWRYLWRQLDGDSSAVEDALQEVFLAVWRSAAAFRGESRVNTWLFRIAHHYVRNQQRAIARRPEGRLAAPEPTDSASHNDDNIAWNPAQWGQESHENAVVARLTLAEALDHLSASHREALELVFEQGFTLAEVAQILAVPIGTVKSRISYARRALQRELERSDGADRIDMRAPPTARPAAPPITPQHDPPPSEALAPSAPQRRTERLPATPTTPATPAKEERHP